MQSDSFGLFHSKNLAQPRRASMRHIEWLITILFIVVLIIVSGIFFNASNAAGLNAKQGREIASDPAALIPGTLHYSAATKNPEIQQVASRMLSAIEDDSCELKP